jgi:hypothetical protein
MLDSGSPNAAHARRGASATMSAPTQQAPLKPIPSRILISVIFHSQRFANKLIERLSAEWFTKCSMSYYRDSGAAHLNP